MSRYPFFQIGEALRRKHIPFRTPWCLGVLVVLLFPSLFAQGREHVDLLVRGGTVVTIDARDRVIEQGIVAIRGDQIIAVGPAAELEPRYQAAKTLEAGDNLILPGFVNTHNHAPMVLFRGIADDVTLMKWLTEYIFPAEAKNVDAEFVRWGTLLACAEMIRSGTTTYADMYYFEDTLAEATRQAGMRGVLGQTVINFPAPDHATPVETLKYTEQFLKRWKNDALIHPAVAPHSAYTVTSETMKACRELAQRYQAPLIIHLSESQDEQRQIREKYGKTPTGYLDDLGILSSRVLAAHCVWVNDQDLEILVKRGVGISHNPESNMKLASGTAPVAKMLKMGARLGLGTDGAASNNNLNMFEAMDTASKLQKLHLNDPAVLKAKDVVRMATIGGARALHMEKEIGSIEAGKKADLILLATNRAHLLPRYDVYSHLVYTYQASDVEVTIIGGKVVFDHGRYLTIDKKAVFAKAREYRRRILDSLKDRKGK